MSLHQLFMTVEGRLKKFFENFHLQFSQTQFSRIRTGFYSRFHSYVIRHVGDSIHAEVNVQSLIYC